MARLTDLIKSDEIEYSNNDLIVESLESLVEMVENDSLSDLEIAELVESIEDIFNSVLEEENKLLDYDDDEMKTVDYHGYTCKVLEVLDDSVIIEFPDGEQKEVEFEELQQQDDMVKSIVTESKLLNRTSMKDRMKARKYSKTAAGKKSKRLAAKKRKKYAQRISRCAEKGKSFSFKTMSCTLKKHRR